MNKSRRHDMCDHTAGVTRRTDKPVMQRREDGKESGNFSKKQKITEKPLPKKMFMI